MTMFHRIGTWLARPMGHKIESIKLHVRSLAYYAYCKFHGYDFDGFISKEDLDGGNSVSQKDAVAFQSYPEEATVTLVSEALARDGGGIKVFVDVGCGKGKQCIKVARRFAFDDVMGIDFSSSLIQTAQNNLIRSGLANVRFEVQDALEWVLPDKKCLVFLYNPFGETVLRAFLQNNRTHFLKYRSVIAYGNDIHTSVLSEMGFDMVYRSSKLNNSIFMPCETNDK